MFRIFTSQKDHLIIANLGDSRAVLCTREDHDQLVADQLTVDLKPNLPSNGGIIYKSMLYGGL